MPQNHEHPNFDSLHPDCCRMSEGEETPEKRQSIFELTRSVCDKFISREIGRQRDPRPARRWATKSTGDATMNGDIAGKEIGSPGGAGKPPEDDEIS
jgi:hypothetical protein